MGKEALRSKGQRSRSLGTKM